MLVLEVVVQAQALGRQVLADDGHSQIRAVPAAVFGAEWIAVVAGGVGEPFGLIEQKLPLLVGEPTAIPVGTSVFTSMVEEADVVVALLERFDLALDERVELIEIADELGRDVEVHPDSLAHGQVDRRTQAASSAWSSCASEVEPDPVWTSTSPAGRSSGSAP